MTRTSDVAAETDTQIAGLPPHSCDCHVHVFGPVDRFPLAPEATYRPPPADLDALDNHHRSLGVERVVLVQPSVYGTDNRYLIASLRQAGDRARGVAVIGLDVSGADLLVLRSAGVRGVRLNLAADRDRDPSAIRADIATLAERIGPLGWHLQIFASSAVLATLSDAFEHAGIPIVVDHFGRGRADDGEASAAILTRLLGKGRVFVKLSASYLVAARPDLSDAYDAAATFARANPAGILWGTNWPHVAGGTGQAVAGTASLREVDDAGLLARLRERIPEVAFDAMLVGNPSALYGWG